MIKKQFVKSRKVAKITFELTQAELPAGGKADSDVVVGEFNNWDPAASPMTYSKRKKAFWVSLELEPGRAYQFRYFVDNELWCNDWQADAYIPSGMGQDNCVVVAPVGPESAR